MTHAEIIHAIRANIAQVIVGRQAAVDLLLAAVMAKGHVLLEDVPGTGKTTLAKALARSIDLKFSRIQFTPDLLPSDVTGLNYFNQKEGNFILRKGPVFTNLLLADEINRATPRTQSSLLEAMEERQVSIDGVTHRLALPFFVIATQNPVETTGTYPLPEAQLDRFLMQISVGFPDKAEELAILARFEQENPLNTLKAVCTADDLIELQEAAQKVYVHPALREDMVELVQATRDRRGEGMMVDLGAGAAGSGRPDSFPTGTTGSGRPDSFPAGTAGGGRLVNFPAGAAGAGISPRGTLALFCCTRAYALVQGRSFVVPEDIKALAVPVLAHRLGAGRLSGRRLSGPEIIHRLLNTLPLPTEDWGRAR